MPSRAHAVSTARRLRDLARLGLTQAGYRIGFDPSIRFEHDSTTFRAVHTRITPMWKIYYYYRNLIILYRIATGAWFIPVLFWYLPRWLLAISHYGPDKRLFLRLYGLALWDGLRGRTDRPRARILDIASAALACEITPGGGGAAARGPVSGE